MKKLLSLTLVAALVIGFASCKKNNSTDTGTNPYNTTTTGTTAPVTPTIPVGVVPTTFVQKGILEEFTGEWCGWCPTGATIMQALVDANSDKFYGAALHDGDPFEIPLKQVVQSHIIAGAGISSLGYPCGSVSRFLSNDPDYPNSGLEDRNYWDAQTAIILGRTPKCGLALVTKESGDNLDIDVYIGQNSGISANTKLTIYLLENDLPESAPGAQASGGGSYIHQHVVRKALTADLGDVVDLAAVPKDKYTKITYKNLSIAGLYSNKNKLKVLAFINVDAPTGKDLDVLNAQEAGLNEIKKWN